MLSQQARNYEIKQHEEEIEKFIKMIKKQDEGGQQAQQKGGKYGRLPPEKYKPMMSSSESYGFHTSEELKIDQLRQWSYEYFKTVSMFDTYTKLPSPIISENG